MTGTATVRIAMWSGPRNISTALMRSFENRADTEVVDEPFYAAYLAATGLDHPMRQEVIDAGETDPRRVAAAPPWRGLHHTEVPREHDAQQASTQPPFGDGEAVVCSCGAPRTR